MRTRGLLVILLVVSLGCLLLIAGCDSDDVSSTTDSLDPDSSTTEAPSTTEGASVDGDDQSSGWLVFESENVSLGLPNDFVLLKDYADAMQPDDTMVEFPIEMESPELTVISTPGSYSTVASVTALFLADPHVSDLTIDEYADAVVSDLEFVLEDVEILSEDIGEQRAEVVVVGYYEADTGGTTEMVRSLHRFVIFTGTSWYCRVDYIYEGAEDIALDAVFEASADTVVFKTQ